MERNSDELAILIGQKGPLNGQRWTLQSEMCVGRDPDCEIVITERQVSRRHARFHATSKGIQLEDLNSKNGTHINGEQITNPILLKDGDVIQIAFAQQFAFLSSDATLPLDESELKEARPKQGKLVLDKRSRRVWIGEEEVLPPLSVAQFAMLDLLYNQDGLVVTREELIDVIWGEENAYDVSNQALDALVRRLRDRLMSVDDKHSYIVTVRGHGLRLDNPPP